MNWPTALLIFCLIAAIVLLALALDRSRRRRKRAEQRSRQLQDALDEADARLDGMKCRLQWQREEDSETLMQLVDETLNRMEEVNNADKNH